MSRVFFPNHGSLLFVVNDLKVGESLVHGPPPSARFTRPMSAAVAYVDQSSNTCSTCAVLLASYTGTPCPGSTTVREGPTAPPPPQPAPVRKVTATAPATHAR